MKDLQIQKDEASFGDGVRHKQHERAFGAYCSQYLFRHRTQVRLAAGCMVAYVALDID